MNFFFLNAFLFLDNLDDESTARSKMNLHFRFLIDDRFLYLVILGIVVGIDAILQYDCFVISIREEIKLQGERALIPVALTANIPALPFFLAVTIYFPISPCGTMVLSKTTGNEAMYRVYGSSAS